MLTPPRRRDPASADKGTLFLVEDQVSRIRQTARVPDATRLPVDIAEEDRGVRLVVVVHEHKLLAKLVLELPQIAPRPLLDCGSSRNMVIGQAHQLVLVHAADNDRCNGGSRAQESLTRGAHETRKRLHAPLVARSSLRAQSLP